MEKLKKIKMDHARAVNFEDDSVYQFESLSSLLVTHVSNPLSPNSDKYQFSSDDIHTLSRD